MNIKTNNIYIVLPVKNYVANVIFDDLSKVEYNGDTYYIITGSKDSTDIMKKITFDTLEDNATVTLTILASSETNFDYAYSCELDGPSGYTNAVYKTSGDNVSIEAKYTVATKGSHYIYVGYRKDGSGSKYNDCGYFKIENKTYEIKQPDSIYLNSQKLKELNYGDKKLLEYGYTNKIKWTNVNQNNSTTNGNIGISYSYTNTKSKKSFKGVAYCSNDSFLKDLIDNAYNKINYIRFKEENNIKYSTSVGGATYSYTYSIDLSDVDFSRISDISNMFDGWPKFSELKLPDNFTENKTSLSNMFYRQNEYHSNYLAYLDVSNWDTSNVTDMSSMFVGCKYLSYLDVSKWNTGNVTNMSSMFSTTDYYRSPIYNSLTYLDVSNWDTSNVTDMSSMFVGCKYLSYLDVSKWNTSNVTNMSSMFYGCTGLTSLDVSKLDTTKVTNMTSMFENCAYLTSLDVSNFNTSKVTNMSNMFYHCRSLTSLDVSKLDTSNVTDMTRMFYGCTGLTSLDVSKLDTTKVTNMTSMFENCAYLTSLDLSNWDTSNMNTNAKWMFYDCWSLTSLDLSNWDTTNILLNETFVNCNNLKTIIMKNCSEASRNKIKSAMPSGCTIVTE